MKAYRAVLARFCIVTLIAELLFACAGLFVRLLAGGSVAGFLVPSLIAAVPATICTGLFSAFFQLNRQAIGRFSGYAMLIIMGMVSMVAAGLVARWSGADITADLDAGLLTGYGTVLGWFGRAAKAHPLVMLAAFVSFNLFIAAFWGISRIVPSRPLLAALLTAAGYLAALYAHSVFGSGTVDALFVHAGLTVPRELGTAMASSLAALLLILLDLQFAAAPSGTCYG
jgi:hypothetical protein